MAVESWSGRNREDFMSRAQKDKYAHPVAALSCLTHLAGAY